jgi:hypothetical protein
LLVRDLGMSWPPGCDARDALEVFFASDEAVAEFGCLAADLLCCDVATFRAVAVAVVLARLAGRLATELVLATEAVVGAVAAAGRRTGLVGDRGRALVLGEVGDVSLTPLLVGTASGTFGLPDCVAFGPADGKDLRSGFGKVGDRRDVFEVIFPDSSVVAVLGEEIFFWKFGVFCVGLLGVVGDFVEIRGRIRPPGGRTDIAFLPAMKFPLGGGSFRASFILVANDADCEVDVGFAAGLDFVGETFCGMAPTLTVLEGEDSNAEPFRMTPKPPSNSAGFRLVASAGSLGPDPPVPLVATDGRSTGFADSWC